MSAFHRVYWRACQTLQFYKVVYAFCSKFEVIVTKALVEAIKLTRKTARLGLKAEYNSDKCSAADLIPT